MMWELAFLLLPIAAYSGWYVGRKGGGHSVSAPFSFSKEYYTGLQYLLAEQPDKAMDAFVRALDSSPETVETTLALGTLFRRRGEVDRAIHLHQELLFKPNLTRYQRGQALLELAQDYMGAGVYDRAEELFRELAQMGGGVGERGQEYLIRIFERERDWERAIQAAKSYQASSMVFMGQRLAQYYCEKALLAKAQGDFPMALKELRSALHHDKACVRASLVEADLDFLQGRYKAALRALKRIEQQDMNFIPEVIEKIAQIYELLNLETELDDYLGHLMKNGVSVAVVLVYAQRLEKKLGSEQAVRFMTGYLRQYPSVRGIRYLVNFHLKRALGTAKEELSLLLDLLEKWLQQKPVYQCVQCGFSVNAVHWQCPSCEEWGSIKPLQGLEVV